MHKRFSFGSQFATVWSMTKYFTKRYFRDKVALFFTLLFPLIFLFVFGTIFGGTDGPSFNVAIINNSNSEFAKAFVETGKSDDVLKTEDVSGFDEAKEKLGRGEIDGIIELPENFGQLNQKNQPSGQLVIYYDEGDEQVAGAFIAVMQSVLDGINKEFVDVNPPFKLDARTIQTANLSRFDYLFAGLVGFSILSLGIFSMSEGFTGDKKNGSLRRLRVAPIRPWQIISATALNRIFVGIVTVALMFVVAVVVFDFNMRGDYISFLLFTIISTICLFGFGMAIAGWAKDSNQAAPLSNLVSFPMMFLSGVFFPVFLMPDWLQKVTQFIPLTPVVEGLRRITTEGQTILELGPQLAVIAAWTVVIYVIAFKTFRWE